MSPILISLRMVRPYLESGPSITSFIRSSLEKEDRDNNTSTVKIDRFMLSFSHDLTKVNTSPVIKTDLLTASIFGHREDSSY